MAAMPRQPTALRTPAEGAADDAARPAVSTAGLVAAARAAGLSLLAVTVVVLVGWATAADGGASASEALASAVQAWLLAHHGVLATPSARFGLVPLGLTGLPAALLFVAADRAARSTAVAGLRAAVTLTAALSASYALLAAALALVAGTATVRPLPVSAFLGAGAVAAVVGGAGVLRGAGLRRRAWRRVPVACRLAATAGLLALGVLLCGGALLAGLALARHHARATELFAALDAGAAGGLLLLLLCLAYVPTAVLWATAYAVGPGFGVGVGTSVAVTGHELGATPGFPLLAALPAEGAPPPYAWLALAVPVAAGVLAGLSLDRTDTALARPVLTSWRRALGAGWGAGAATGVGLLALVLLAGGPAGPGRLAEVGPSAWLLPLAAAAEVGLLATGTLLVRRRHLLPFGPRPAPAG
jgi:hypothetical protein